jgi:ABC-type antimicrobial peptide transport system permease subunit
MSYSVGLRSREIGIRIALGSRPGEVIRMILRQAGLLVGLGIGIGVVCSLMLSQILTTLLYGIKPTDVLSYVAAASALGLVALAASFIPARRAARIDPMQSLRAD